jgi:outer membrane protein
MNTPAIYRILCAATLAIAAASALAQQPATIHRIGIVNPERILAESAPAKRATERLKAEFAKRETELAGMADQARRIQAELERDGITMAAAERQRKERTLAEMDQEFQRKKRSFDEDLAERRNASLQEVSELADKAIRQVAQQEKYDMIMREAVYANPAIDITDKVIQALAGGAKPAAK